MTRRNFNISKFPKKINAVLKYMMNNIKDPYRLMSFQHVILD